MHYDEKCMDYFRCKYCKSHISQQHVRWLCLHKDCAELEEPFELCNLDFIGGKHRPKMTHRIDHKMMLLIKQPNQEHWRVTSEIMSQEEFVKNDIRCIDCKNFCASSGYRWLCEDCMPDKTCTFPIYCGTHYKSHKKNHPTHILQKQVLVGIAWIEDRSESPTKVSK